MSLNAPQQKTDDQSLQQYQQRVGKQLPILYSFGIFASAMHLIVGITWENVEIVDKKQSVLPLSYMGGYLILISIAFTLIFSYFLLMLRKENTTPKYIRRFGITLCIIVAGAQTILGAILPIRAKDYHSSQAQLSGSQYSAVMMLTVLDIMFVYVAIPHFIYLLYVHCMVVRKMPDDKDENEEERGQGNIRQGSSERRREGREGEGEDREVPVIMVEERDVYEFEHELEREERREVHGEGPSNTVLFVQDKEEKIVIEQEEYMFEEEVKKTAGPEME